MYCSLEEGVCPQKEEPLISNKGEDRFVASSALAAINITRRKHEGRSMFAYKWSNKAGSCILKIFFSECRKMILITEYTHLITIYIFKTSSWLYPSQSAQQPSQSSQDFLSQEKLEHGNSFTSALQPLLCPNCIYPSELLELQEAQDSVRQEIMSLGKSYRSDLAGDS